MRLGSSVKDCEIQDHSTRPYPLPIHLTLKTSTPMVNVQNTAYGGCRMAIFEMGLVVGFQAEGKRCWRFSIWSGKCGIHWWREPETNKWRINYEFCFKGSQLTCSNFLDKIILGGWPTCWWGVYCLFFWQPFFISVWLHKQDRFGSRNI